MEKGFFNEKGFEIKRKSIFTMEKGFLFEKRI